MLCPHCRVQVHRALRQATVIRTNEDLPYENHWIWSASMICPSCGRPIVFLFKAENREGEAIGHPRDLTLVHPARSESVPPPLETPPEIARDFVEAGLVLNDSPKAAAALARRCLQAVLNEHGYTARDLAKQIDAILADEKVPSYIHNSVDMIRNFGNFSAHPVDDKTTLQVIDVEPEEAQTCLDILRSLFDFYYVQPARIKSMKAELDQKLQAAGKPPSK